MIGHLTNQSGGWTPATLHPHQSNLGFPAQNIGLIFGERFKEAENVTGFCSVAATIPFRFDFPIVAVNDNENIFTAIKRQTSET